MDDFYFPICIWSQIMQYELLMIMDLSELFIKGLSKKALEIPFTFQW